MIGWNTLAPSTTCPPFRRWTCPRSTALSPGTQVGEEEGTGIVHIAPGCGAEDFELGEIHDLPALAPLTRTALFLSKASAGSPDVTSTRSPTKSSTIWRTRTALSCR
jgi:isoleucyl-tRNA synthetase